MGLRPHAMVAVDDEQEDGMPGAALAARRVAAVRPAPGALHVLDVPAA